jgi:hypothetical protein
MTETYRISVPCTQDPTKSITLEYSKDLIEDLKALVGLDGEAELRRVLQAEADAEYEHQFNKPTTERVWQDESN